MDFVERSEGVDLFFRIVGVVVALSVILALISGGLFWFLIHV